MLFGYSFAKVQKNGLSPYFKFWSHSQKKLASFTKYRQGLTGTKSLTIRLRPKGLSITKSEKVTFCCQMFSYNRNNISTVFIFLQLIVKANMLFPKEL